MSLPTSLKTLLSGEVVESARIEFKETWDPEASLKTICAFANDLDNWGGGYLVVGVRDKPGIPRELIGVYPEKIDGYLKDILNKCKLIQPEYMPLVDVVDHRDKKFIVIWAPGGANRPYSSPKSMGKENKERVYWIRKASSTIKPTESQKRDLYGLANDVPFDDRVNHTAQLDDLNVTLIRQFLYEVESSLYQESSSMEFVELCRRMNLISGIPEYPKPKNAALMFFNPSPDRFFPYAQIDVVQFPDGLGGDRLFEKTFKGPLQQQLRDALLYIQNVVIVEKIVKEPGVAEARRFYNYPYAAIKESLANDVYHKGYDVREPIEVRVLPEKIEILSHPGADRSVSLEGLKKYKAVARRYRNRRIGEFLKELHLTEGRNTGFHKILNALDQNGSPRPLFETDEERSFFLTTLYPHPHFSSQKDEYETGGNEYKTPKNEHETGGNEYKTPKNEHETGGNEYKTPKSSDSDLTELENLIVSELRGAPNQSIAATAERLGKSRSTIARTLSALTRKGRVRREGGARGGKWIVVERGENAQE